MIQDIAFAFWFLLPAAIANAIPIFAAAIPGLHQLNAPIDGGKKFRGHRIFGSHKTWRGVISGMLAATLVLWVQQLVVQAWGGASFFSGGLDYASLPLFLLGPAFAIGALGGDALESFAKRQRGIKSGGAWVPFDQLDYIVGSILLTMPFVLLSPMQYTWMIIIWFCIHLLASFIGYKMGLKKDPI